jgi:hypothetical protein
MADTDQNVASWFAANPEASLQDAIAAGESVGINASQAQNYYNQYSPQAAPLSAAPTPYSAIVPTVAPTVTTFEDLYKNDLGRAPDAAGLKYWQDTYGTGPLTTEAMNAFKSAEAPELAAKKSTDAWFNANPNATKEQIASAIQSNGGLTPQLASVLAQRFGTDENTIQSNYNNAIQDKQYTDLVTNAYGGIGRTGVGTAASNIDQAGLDYWKGQLAAGAIAPDQFNNVFGNAVRQYKTEHPDDQYTQYVNNYQLGQQAEPMKSGLENVFADKKISWEEANQINDYYTQYGFKPEDIARVTGRSLDEVKQALGARGDIIGQNITSRLDSPVSLVEYAQDNKLSAKDLASASGGVLSEESAKALLDKGSTYAGRVELQDPEAYKQIKGIISRAVNKDYGGVEHDWMYKMLGGLDKNEVSQTPKQLEMTPTKTETRTGSDEGGEYKYQVVVPGEAKNTSGLTVERDPESGEVTGYSKPVVSKDFDSGANLTAHYDKNGTLTGYDSRNRIYTSDPDWIGARWNADGSPAAYGGHTAGGGFIKSIGNDVASFTQGLGPIWTAAKIAFPELNLVDVGADVARSEVGLNTAVKGALGYAGMQDASAADLTNPSSVNATSGLDIGSGVSPAVQMTQNAQYAKLGAAGLSAGMAADKGNYAPLLALAANVSGANKMPEVSMAANTLAAANAIATNNPAALMSAAGNLTNSPDLRLAGAATNLLQAQQSGNQSAIAVAAMGFASAVNTNAPSASSTLKTTIFGPTKIDTSSLPQGSPINPSGPSADASGAGPLSGINTASADGSIPQVEVGGAPIFAGTANAAKVSVPVGYRLMTMDEADARPAGSYYDITQNAWIAPDEEGMTELRNLQGALSGPAPDGYGRDVTNLDSSAVTGGLSGATSTGGAPSSNIGEIVVTADRPTSEIPEIVVTADRPVVNDAGEIVITADRPVTETPVVTPPVVTPPAATSPSTPINPTPTKITQASSPLSAAAQPAQKLDSSPQGLTSTMQRDKKILKELTMLFGTLTPELVSALEDRGIRVPQAEDIKRDNKDDEEQPTEKQLAEDKNLETKFAAAGGEITSKIDQKINYVQPGLFAAAPVLEQQPRVGALKHLHEGLVPRRATVGMAKGGLPSKYAEATPKGHNPEFITGLTGYYASGEGTGQSDDIDALLHDGDYVADADLVAALGDGSSKAGAEALEKFRRSVPHQEHAEGGQPVAAKIADGEYVFPASFVTAIGKGDNKAGAAVLDKMREAIRAHKRSAPTSKIPPKAKSPLDYLKMVKG